MKRKLVTTADGAHSFYIEELDENYHSIHGSIQEAQVVFIDAGLKYFSSDRNLKILEIGFGTGLNTFMTLLAAKNQQISYAAIEAYPITIEESKLLNYTKELHQEDLSPIFNQLHECEWDKEVEISPNFKLTKLSTKIEDFKTENSQFDIIYFDAFAPSAQPHLWESTIFNSMYNALKCGGILVTYCAKGSVKRTMKSVGFEIQALPGPKGKREMTRAVKRTKD